MYKPLETRLLALRQQPIRLNLYCFLVAAVISGAYISTTTLRLKKAAETLGSLGFICGLVAVAFYVVREFFVRKQKSGSPLSPSGTVTIRNLMMDLRAIHPVAGTLMLYFILCHGFFMLKAGQTFASSRIIFGTLALIGLFIMMILGVKLVKQAALRQTHRLVLLFVFILFLMHLYIKFKL